MAQNLVSSRHFTWLSGFDFEQLLMYEIAFRKMGAIVVKRNVETTLKECLLLFNQDRDVFLHLFKCVDKIWIHFNTPETKLQLKQGVSPDKSVPKRA